MIVHSFDLTCGQSIIMFLYAGSWCQGGLKKKGGTDTPFCTKGGTQPKICSFPNLEKIPPPTWKNLPVRLLPLGLANTKFLFPQASMPKPLNCYRHNSTMISAPPPPPPPPHTHTPTLIWEFAKILWGVNLYGELKLYGDSNIYYFLSFYLQVCLIMYELLLTNSMNGLIILQVSWQEH